ncbi:MAG TPA: serine/threonine-protein kinase, partial [Candidatus Omnitrophota bacterium]|nr:serine/threonine-protein kinase [Candidatus Omnitrophota bacterium]
WPGTPLRSSSAKVFRAIDRRDGRVVAVKLFSPRGRLVDGRGYGADDWRARFLEEARSLAAIAHPHVVPVLDRGGEDGPNPWYAMPWMVANLRREIGRDAVAPAAIARLAEHERPRAVTPARAVAVLAQVALGLAELHSRGIVHRDVKPSNLLLSARQGGAVMLCDLGAARLPDLHSSRAGVWVGTPNYMAPEQREDSATASDRADVFSLGVLGYRLAVGRLLNHAMAPDPADRPSATEMAAALAEMSLG